jgi:hypothetical protein
MKTCRNCGKSFPFLTEINGKVRNSGYGRKFCYDCSPFGLRNTKQSVDHLCVPEGQRKCSVCNLIYPATLEYFFERKKGSILRGECKGCHKAKVNKRNSNGKEYFVNLLGGKCSICGYNKCLAALDFHHINEKQFTPSKLLKLIDRDKAYEEIKKCILLCANCHREEHNCK